MLILTSNGLSSEKLQNEVKPFINGCKVALVVTADNEYKEKNYHVERLTAELGLLGAEVKIFDFDNSTPSELRGFDAVEMIGGNPFYLLNSIKNRGFSDILREFAHQKCIIGCSAGSFVMTKTLELVNIYSPELNIVGMQELDALSLTEVEILPHYSRFLQKFDEFENRCAEYERLHNREVIRLNDGDAVIITDAETKTIIAE